MSRRTTTKKRLAVPDPVYNSRLVSMLTVRILKEGKKHLAQRIIYQAFDIIKEKTGEEPLTVLESAIRKVTPLVEVKARRVGGSTYQVPMEVRPKRAQTLAMKWIVDSALKRNENLEVDYFPAEKSFDATKLKDKLQWEPKANFEEALKETIVWYIDKYKS